MCTKMCFVYMVPTFMDKAIKTHRDVSGHTVNSEIFARFFLRTALKDIFAK